MNGNMTVPGPDRSPEPEPIEKRLARLEADLTVQVALALQESKARLVRCEATIAELLARSAAMPPMRPPPTPTPLPLPLPEVVPTPAPETPSSGIEFTGNS